MREVACGTTPPDEKKAASYAWLGVTRFLTFYSPMDALLCLVVAIVDGDTLIARCGQAGAHQQVKVRIAGIDAPERRQPYANRARQALFDLCFSQSAEIIQRKKDRYGRAVADVKCKNHDAATWMVAAGWAMVYQKYANQHGHLYQVEQSARNRRAGQWTMLNEGIEPTPPWQWRRSNSSFQLNKSEAKRGQAH